ncbi:hypothetical protein IT403_01275 [Candidatus Nomurabacteria bacterium]|nr:hypothetical protein [Candidatus Nomurabacteria bacterium]
MKSLFFLAMRILGIIIAAIYLPATYPLIALVLYGTLWLMLKFGIIQQILDGYKKYLDEDVYDLKLKPIEEALPQIQLAVIPLCVYALLLLTTKNTPLLAPYYWAFDESSRFWIFHIAILGCIVTGSQLSDDHAWVKNVMYGITIVLFIIPTFFEGKVWKIQQGDEIVYEIPAYAHERVKWYWKSNKPYQVKINDENVWFQNGKVPSDYINPQQVKKITIRTEPADKPYIATVEIWSRIDL